ncbi:hypothetical protein [Psychrobacter sp. I-STPA10]|uniref:hypothetical protein n=1 Tax=Psychrobacter sp. I-STPA10 TaxID=2585769 RepID=UPI001E31CF8E|nr:hypothetical protein [Psychrobacter sp. I-STPA10]
MKKLTASLLIAASTLVASPAVLAATADNAAKTVNVQFKRGTSSAHYTGKVNGYKYHDYTFRARKGQKLQVKLSGGNVEPYLFHSKLSDSVNVGVNSPELTNGVYVLPYDGTYTLRINQPRASARDGKTQQYWLMIGIR